MSIENLHPEAARQALQETFATKDELAQAGGLPSPPAADMIFASVDDDGTPVPGWVPAEDLIPEPGGGGSVSEWGDLTGDISDQTDLKNALDAKVDTTRTISAGTGLAGGGDLSANRTLSLSTGVQASLELADTAVQPNDFEHTIRRWVLGEDPEPDPVPSGVRWEVWLGEEDPVPEWCPPYTLLVRLGESEDEPDPEPNQITATLLGSFASSGNVTTSGAINIGELEVDTHILVLVAAGATPTLGVSNTNSNSWTSLGSNTASSLPTTVEAFITKVTSSNDDDVSVTRSSSGGLSVAIYQLEGADGTLTGSVATVGSESGVTSASSGAISAVEGGLVVFAVGSNSDISGVTGSGNTDAAAQFSASGTGNPRTLAVGLHTATSTGNKTLGLLWSPGRAWTGIAMAFDPEEA